MNIQVLDCTLRDGGYVVNTVFEDYVIKGITAKLTNAKIDIIEIGYVKDCIRKAGSTTFADLSEIKPYLPQTRSNDCKYAVMIEYNTFDLTKLISSAESGIDIIRVCFFKNDRFKVFDYIKKMINSGYEIFLQPMDTLSYSDFELLEMIELANKHKVQAMYIVDSYGSMYTDDVERLFSLINHNLDTKISLGLHSHNNLQLSFMLTQRIIELCQNKRNVIVDASCEGIGRGAGNTNTELVIDYLVRKKNKNYDMNEILDILDTYIHKIRKNHDWGYSTPYFISGMYSVHVNNINYLLNKHNLKAKDMRAIVSCIDKNSEKRYDYEKLEADLINYFSKEVNDTTDIEQLKDLFYNRKILLIAPGNSINKNINKIKNYIKEYNPIVIGINSINPEITVDYLFYSNILRYDYSAENYSQIFEKTKKIITSNVSTTKNTHEFIINYNTLIKRGWHYFDNSTIMCLRLLSKLSIKDIAIAGFDGYSLDNNETCNYIDKNIIINLSTDDKRKLNNELSEMLKDYQKTNNDIKLSFITSSLLI